jgi:hypothetical protein
VELPHQNRVLFSAGKPQRRAALPAAQLAYAAKTPAQLAQTIKHTAKILSRLAATKQHLRPLTPREARKEITLLEKQDDLRKMTATPEERVHFANTLPPGALRNVLRNSASGLRDALLKTGTVLQTPTQVLRRIGERPLPKMTKGYKTDRKNTIEMLVRKGANPDVKGALGIPLINYADASGDLLLPRTLRSTGVREATPEAIARAREVLTQKSNDEAVLAALRVPGAVHSHPPMLAQRNAHERQNLLHLSSYTPSDGKDLAASAIDRHDFALLEHLIDRPKLSLPPTYKDRAVKMAAYDGATDFLKTVLSKGRVLKESVLRAAFNDAASNSHSDAARVISNAPNFQMTREQRRTALGTAQRHDQSGIANVLGDVARNNEMSIDTIMSDAP